MTEEEGKTENKEEELIDKKGYPLKIELAKKAMVGHTEESNEIVKEAREIYLNEIRYRKKIQMTKYENDVYIIAQDWYNKWKKYVRYTQIKKTCRNPEIYIRIRPLIYTPNPELDPGKIINKDLISDSSETVIHNYEVPVLKLFARNKTDYRILPTESFEMLNKRFGCDYILKGALTLNRMYFKKFDYNFRTRRLNLILLPTRKVIQGVKRLVEVNINIPEYTVENELKIFLAKIFNTEGNKKFKELIGYDQLNENTVKIYHILDDGTNQGFRQFFESNLKKFQEGEKVDASEHLRRLSEKFQISQFQYFNLVIDFSKSEEEELFSNIGIDVEKPEEPKDYFKLWERNNLLNQKFGTTDDNQISTNEYANEFQTQDLSNFPIDKNDNQHGLVGLDNIGNTCYMNTAIQCLSNCKILTNYFLQDYYIPFINRTNTIGSKGKIVESYAEVIKHLWYGEKKMIEPYRLKNECGMVRNMFAGYNQQDAQEFISFLLDELHEDLNKVLIKPYIEKDDNLVFASDIEECIYNKNNFLARNQSIIVDLFYGMFKSTVVCPNQDCKNISKSYDPYSVISIPINVKAITKEIIVYFIFEKFEYKIIQYKMTVPYDMGIYSFRKKIEYLFQIGYNTFEIYKNKGNELVLIKDENMGVFDFLDYNTEIYLYQIPNIVFDKSNENTVKIYEELMNNPYLLDNREKEFNGKKNMDSISDPKLEINREKWIKFYCYINSYDDEGFPNLQISLPKIFYINIDWNNEQIYNYIFEQYENLLYENEKPENLKEKLFPNLNNVTRNLSKRKNFKFDIKTHNEFNYPYMLLYEKFAPIHDNLLKRYDNFKDLIFPSSEKLQTIKKVIEHLKGENKYILEHELIFKLVCSPTFKEKIKELKEPKKMINKVTMFSSKEESINIQLTSLLGQFSQLETLSEGNEWYCSKCKEFQLADKTMEIFTCPEILIFHLKRFREGKKLDNIIEFPIKGLDMGQYIKYDETNKNDNIYDLFAVANHQGNFNGGHYVAYAKNFIKDKWYEFDDEYIKEINENEIVSENSYVLFYQKRNSKFENVETVYKKPFTNIVFKK